MKKTAVEWLIDILVNENEVTLKGENYKLFEIAKEMEKDQIVQAASWTPEDGLSILPELAKQYYNETFKSE